MRYLKRFNESRDVTILQKLSKALEQNIDYDFDRDYDDVFCHMTYGKNGTWTNLIDSIYNIIKPELNRMGSNIEREDFEKHIGEIIPTSFTIGYQDEDFIESVYDSDGDFDWDLEDEDDRSQRGINIKYENIANAILKKFGII